MARIPEAAGVASAIRAVRKALQRSLNAQNAAAGKAMTAGKYEQAEGMAEVGRRILEFDARMDALAKEWRGLGRKPAGTSSAPSTPLWRYYQPILRALIGVGGTASRRDIEPHVFSLIKDDMSPGDRAKLSNGQERWQRAIQRARKSLEENGWIVFLPGKVMQITEAGRKAAEGEELAVAGADS